MKKLTLLIAMILCVTIGGVYATWTYTQNTDVADEKVNMTMNLTDVAFSGSYGTYKVDTSNVKLEIDPKEGTTHVTALYVTGDIVITFTPNSVAPDSIKKNGVESWYQFGLTNTNWTYDGQPIVTLEHQSLEEITWNDDDKDGVFTFIISSSELSSHIHLTEFLLDTKAKYDEYNTALGNGQITINVTDGYTSNT